MVYSSKEVYAYNLSTYKSEQLWLVALGGQDVTWGALAHPPTGHKWVDEGTSPVGLTWVIGQNVYYSLAFRDQGSPFLEWVGSILALPKQLGRQHFSPLHWVCACFNFFYQPNIQTKDFKEREKIRILSYNFQHLFSRLQICHITLRPQRSLNLDICIFTFYHLA